MPQQWISTDFFSDSLGQLRFSGVTCVTWFVTWQRVRFGRRGDGGVGAGAGAGTRAGLRREFPSQRTEAVSGAGLVTGGGVWGGWG
jgi:hypothetical protein